MKKKPGLEEVSFNVKVKKPPTEGKPFVLIWADEVALETLRIKRCCFFRGSWWNS
ncbi:hypothetical protein [Pseudomonas veronii]|uniref:hypothetical protein n=1 Tax=Pseudomonas veronii TaxID=76761 RepID=UPI002659E486|nr:hypothetical protein [Pseudomonas veronii]WKC46931.1 hypothetical protein QYP03_00375 [Pseudomonas veronii]